mgnify:CR=1 FL=1
MARGIGDGNAAYIPELTALMAKDAPRYVLIRERLRREILTGVYGLGDRIPSEESIAESSKVSRMTARRAVSDLVNDGLLHRRTGVGTFVVGRRFLRDQSRLVSFWEATVALGMRPSSKLIGKEAVPAPVEIANLLEIPEGELVYHIERLRQANGEPLAYHNVHVPASLFPGLVEQDLANQSLYALYRQYGYPPTSGGQTIEARAADRRIAKLLGVPLHSPVLYIQRVTHALGGAPIELVCAHIRADRYTVYMSLHL